MDAFATYSDLEARLNKTFTSDERAWIAILLEDASTYLREDVIGFQIYPQDTVTFSSRPKNCEVFIPQLPIVEIVSVQRSAVDVPYTEGDNYIKVHGDDPVDITFTFGYAVPPEGLSRWACVLVSETLLALQLELGLTFGGLTSIQIDDFRASFQVNYPGGMQLDARNVQELRRQYGSNIWLSDLR